MILSENERTKLQNIFSLDKHGGLYYEGSRIQKNQATRWLLVGIGGMGTSTLIRIKHEVMTRMKLPEDDHSQLPGGIKFLAIDTKNGDLEKMFYADTKFDRSEILYTGSETPTSRSSWDIIVNGMYNDRRNDENGYAGFLPPQRDDLGRLPTSPAAGEKRLLGRVGLFYHQERVKSFVDQVVRSLAAEAGTVQICLFAGLGGGTGSGSFMDVAFLLKQLAPAITTSATPISAYLFLPDLQNESAGNNGRKSNAFAALKELDQLDVLGSQIPSYWFGKGITRINCTDTPLDYCYLINSVDDGGLTHETEEVITDVAESVFELIADQTDNGEGAGAGISAIQDNATNWFDQNSGAASFPANYRYMSTCSTVKRIPYLEINTLVVSKMFEALSGVWNRVPTEEDMVAALRELGFGNDYLTPGLDLKTGIEQTLMLMIEENTSSSAELSRKRLFTPGRYQKIDIWDDGIIGYEKTRPWMDAYLATKEYQTALNANFSAMTGCKLDSSTRTVSDGENIGTLEGRLKTYMLNALADEHRGPVYLRNIIGSPYCNNLINLFNGMSSYFARISDQEAAEANLAVSDANNGCKTIFARHNHNRRNMDAFLQAVDDWQTHKRLADKYYYMAKLCEVIVKVYQKYYDLVIELLADTVLTVKDIFAANYETLKAREEGYQEHPDNSLLITPMKFIENPAYQPTFDSCVDQAKITFLAFLRDNMRDWIGTQIAHTQKRADCIPQRELRAIHIDESLSGFISQFLNTLYQTVSIEQIYQSKYPTNFTEGVHRELTDMYQSVHPFFHKNALDTAGTVQDFTIFFVPATNNPNIKTEAQSWQRNPEYVNNVQIMYSADVSRISVVKVAEGYSIINNACVKDWEKIYETYPSVSQHIDYRWREAFPSPRTETSWQDDTDRCQHTIDRNEKYREMFRYCRQYGVIVPSDDPTDPPLTALLHVGFDQFLGQTPEEYLDSVKISGDTIEAKKRSLDIIFKNIWRNGTTPVKLSGMGTYKNTANSTDEDRMENIQETTLLNSYLCDCIEREYRLLQKYAALADSLTLPEYYIKAWVCGMMAYSNSTGRSILHSRDTERPLSKDGSIRMNRDDFDYALYQRFVPVLNEKMNASKTWKECIDEHWNNSMEIESRLVLAGRLKTRVSAFVEAKEKYLQMAREEPNPKEKVHYLRIANFYETGLIYANEILSVLISEAPLYYIKAMVCQLMIVSKDKTAYLLRVNSTCRENLAAVLTAAETVSKGDPLLDYKLYTFIQQLLKQKSPDGKVWSEVINANWTQLLESIEKDNSVLSLDKGESLADKARVRLEERRHKFQSVLKNAQLDSDERYFYEEGIRYCKELLDQIAVDTDDDDPEVL